MAIPSSAHSDRGERSISLQILASLGVVALCWFFLRLGSLIVTVAVSHTWHASDPVVSAYAFLFRQLIMVFLYPSVLNVFRPAFIPLYNEIRKAEGPEAAMRFAAGVLEIGMLFAVGTAGLLWGFPGACVGFLAPHFDAAQHAASVAMLREMAPGILFLLLAEMYLILFHAEKKFAYPHGAEATQKILWGIGILAAAHGFGWRNRAIGISYSLACAVQLAINGFGMVRTWGWLVRRGRLREWGRRWGRRAGALALPLLVGIFGARIRDLLTHWLQSSLDAVSYVSVEYARQLTNLPVIFMGTLVSIVMLPHLSSILHSSGRESHRLTVENTVETLSVVSIPVISGILLFAPELTALVFMPSHWGPAEYALYRDAALAMRMISLGFLFVVVENILMPGLFSIQSMWWPVLWGLAASGFQILCLVGLAEAHFPKGSPLLLAGVAFVYPLSRIFKNMVLFFVLRRKIGIFPGAHLPRFVFRLGALGVTCVGAGYLAHRVTGRFLGDIPVGKPMLEFKGWIVLDIALPGLALAGAFLATVWGLGYKERLLEFWESLRLRSRPPAGE